MIKNLKLLKTLLGKKRWCCFVLLIIATFVATLLECVGISLVFPVISVLLDPDFLSENRVGIWLGKFFLVEDSSRFLGVVLLLVGLSYLIKNVYLLGVSYIKNRFVLSCQFELKKRVLYGFFYAPYMQYIDCSTAELVQAVEADVDGSIILMEKMLNICGEIIMIGLLGGLILGVNTEITIGVLLLCGGVFFIFVRFFKPYAEKNSIEYAAARKDFTKWLYQSVGNRKEIKAEKKEYFFMRNFNQFSERACTIDSKVRCIQGLPKMIFEMCFVVCIIGVLLFLINNTADTADAVAQLSLFGIVALRILPSLLRLNQLLGSTFWHAPMLERTVERFREQELLVEHTEKVSPLRFEKELELQGISFAYPGTGVKIFDKASLRIQAGKITGICGLSGAGKTTLIDIIAGLLPVSEGDIRVDGVSLSEEEQLMSWQAGVAYIPQNACLINATIRENILFGSEDLGDAVLWKVLEQAAADDFVKGMPDGLETIVGENGCRLSGGQGQRLVLARALYKKSQLLILDETTSALDVETEGVILKAIERISKVCTVILISHRSSTLEICDEIYRIENGKIKKIDSSK